MAGLLVLAILYILSPLDILPDVIPILGWMDDVLFLRLAIGPAVAFGSRYAAAAAASLRASMAGPPRSTRQRAAWCALVSAEVSMPRSTRAATDSADRAQKSCIDDGCHALCAGKQSAALYPTEEL